MDATIDTASISSETPRDQDDKAEPPKVTMDETIDTASVSSDTHGQKYPSEPTDANVGRIIFPSSFHEEEDKDIEEPSSTNIAKESLVQAAKKDAERNQDSHVSISKVALAVLVILLLLFMGAFGYFFHEWHKLSQREWSGSPSVQDREVFPPPVGGDDSAPIGDGGCNTTTVVEQPELVCEFTKEDLAQLQSEIDRLEDANDQLAEQLVDYDELNDRLNASIQELNLQNEILKDSNDEYEALNGQLNASLADLRNQTTFLAEQVDAYAELNDQLNATAMRLEDEVNRLEDEVNDFSDENDRLAVLVGTLEDERERLIELSDLLEGNVGRLEDKVQEVMTENNRLEILVGDLGTVASFLNETAWNLDGTAEDMAVFLAEQIELNQGVAVATLRNTYHQRVSNWDCALRDHFALEPFAQGNGDGAIPDEKLAAVLDYVDERILSDLCLDSSDFADFIVNRYGTTSSMNFNRLVTSVQRYTWDALDYYFPSGDDDDGLLPVDWADASYECGNLPDEKRFQ